MLVFVSIRAINLNQINMKKLFQKTVFAIYIFAIYIYIHIYIYIYIGLYILKLNSATYRTKSIRCQGANIGYVLPGPIKKEIRQG